MRRRTAAIWLVESMSLFRLLAALLFASLAFQNVPVALVSGLYVFAMCTDLVDGYLARKLNAETYLGKVVDLVSDKSMSIVSLLYAAARGVSVFPLALIAIREVIMIGARLIVVEDKQLLPTNKILGGLFALLLWGNTLFLLLVTETHMVLVVSNIYWVCAIIFTINLLARIYVSADRIKASVAEDKRTNE